eukprot:TRINITY_DN112055_c0_g1_i1.p1 TRINITY_DN112055_c0_g1~~TRINITY_DN112055_c0_g1_i1.p1  ORF type:complete len:419 (-),score=70.70 TRINITY_DN112055_c0_g1_i1:669-1823(-)
MLVGCRTCILGFCEVQEILAYDLLECAVGSPEALLRLHRLLLVEAITALTLLHVQIVVFSVFFNSTSLEDVAVLIVLVVVPILVTIFRIPVLFRLERRCRQLAQSFQSRNAAVATGMVQLLRSTRSRHMQASSLFLVAWYLFCVIWNYIGPPCKDISEPVRFWKLKPEAAPCESFEFICTVLLMANATFDCMLLMAPKAVFLFQGHFVPLQSAGLDEARLRELPEHEFGAPGAPAGEADAEPPTCAICIEVIIAGDIVRRLPCGHVFHKSCVDSWLVRAATCPMRCQVALLDDADAAIAATAAAPSASPDVEEPPLASSGRGPGVIQEDSPDTRRDAHSVPSWQSSGGGTNLLAADVDQPMTIGRPGQGRAEQSEPLTGTVLPL